MKYQYKIEYDYFITEPELNKFGKKGWELISVVIQNLKSERKGEVNNRMIYYFKKEIK